MISENDKRYDNENFVRLMDQCGKKGLEVVLELDDDKSLYIEVYNNKDKLVTHAEYIKENESIEKAADRVYERLLKEGKIEPTRPK